MARFRARAPRAGTVDVKRLIYAHIEDQVNFCFLKIFKYYCLFEKLFFVYLIFEE